MGGLGLNQDVNVKGEHVFSAFRLSLFCDFMPAFDGFRAHEQSSGSVPKVQCMHGSFNIVQVCIESKYRVAAEHATPPICSFPSDDHSLPFTVDLTIIDSPYTINLIINKFRRPPRIS